MSDRTAPPLDVTAALTALGKADDALSAARTQIELAMAELRKGIKPHVVK